MLSGVSFLIRLNIENLFLKKEQKRRREFENEYFFFSSRAQCYFDRVGSVQMEFRWEIVIYQVSGCERKIIEKHFLRSRGHVRVKNTEQDVLSLERGGTLKTFVLARNLCFSVFCARELARTLYYIKNSRSKWVL